MPATIPQKAATTVPWRIVGWGLAAILAVAPALAMQFTNEVAWTVGDFAVFAGMLVITGMGIEVATRTISARSLKLMTICGFIGIFLAVWVLLATAG